MVRRMIGATLVAALFGATAEPAWGWGDDGHIISALIANKYLSPKARAGIRNLIGNRNISDPDIPVWADVNKHKARFEQRYPGNADFHFINIEVTGPISVPQTNGNVQNVMTAIERFRKDVVDPDLAWQKRQDALFFLVHLVPDLHQPLHCGDMGDEGGNQRFVTLSGTNNARNAHDTVKLHAYWDTNLVHDVMGGLDRVDVATRLNDLIPRSKIPEWQGTQLKDWIVESTQLAKDVAYGKASITGDDGKNFHNPIRITDVYNKAARATVAEQLQKGGVRLAKVLNDAFEDE